jgi:hypothetical protein
MKMIAVASVALLAVAIPTTALAGGQGVAMSCGKLEVTRPHPDLGLAKTGTWFLNDFAPTKRQLIQCSVVRRVANTYLAHGTHKGYVVKAFTGLTGRNFYKGAPSAGIGFQIYRPTT